MESVSTQYSFPSFCLIILNSKVNKKQLEVMKIVSEFMIFANVAVAKKIYDTFPDSALLRRHPFPLRDAFEDVMRYEQYVVVVLIILDAR